MIRWLVVLLLVVSVGCSSETKPPAQPTTDAAPRAPQNLRPCTDVYAEGTVIDSKNTLEGPCDNAGEAYIPGAAIYECQDGRTLFWNDEGWGYIGEPFHRHAALAEKVAPEAERNGCPLS